MSRRQSSLQDSRVVALLSWVPGRRPTEDRRVDGSPSFLVPVTIGETRVPGYSLSPTGLLGPEN